ncbi:heat shock 70kDa protein 4 [Schistosoma bovis]|uniref:Heat shock 70kDa protein 4 n=1 Tax=Schistosoma bovis TaxID=6184 RepID=A0A430QB15_SCHBO|nr:heat shock 70kDa protein 4 [Schistosoma bovis]
MQKLAAICSPAFKVKDFTVIEQCLYPIIIQFDQEEGSEQCMQTEEIDGTLTTQGKNMCIEVFPFLHPIPSSRQIVLLRHGVFTLEARYANKDSLPNQNIVIGTFRIGDASQVFTEPRKIKLKMRMNTHGIFNISQAQLIEEYEKEVEVSVSEDNPAVDGPPNSKEEVTTASNGDTESQNPPVDSNQTNMQDSTSPKKKTVMKKKKFTKYHDLSIEVSNMQFTTKQLNEFCEIGANLIQQDKLERERVNSKNAVEEYVYEMRSKLQGPLNPFASPAESESLLQLLDMTEEWLYGDGESLKRHVYVEKLAELRSKGDPIVHRANEHLNRPLAVDNFNRSLVAMESVCHPIINTPKPPTASHTNNTPDLNSQNSGQSNDVNNPNTNSNPGTNHSKKGADDEQNMDLD